MKNIKLRFLFSSSYKIYSKDNWKNSHMDKSWYSSISIHSWAERATLTILTVWHTSLGFYATLILFLFTISGLNWTLKFYLKSLISGSYTTHLNSFTRSMIVQYKSKKKAYKKKTKNKNKVDKKIAISSLSLSWSPVVAS